LRKQIQNSDDVVVNFTSPTSIVLDLEGVDVLNVVTSSNTKKTTIIDIMAQQETTTDENGTCSKFKVTINLQGSTIKNVSMFLSHPSFPIDRTIPKSQGQSSHLQFENAVNLLTCYT
jgi:hypothetical protein